MGLKCAALFIAVVLSSALLVGALECDGHKPSSDAGDDRTYKLNLDVPSAFIIPLDGIGSAELANGGELTFSWMIGGTDGGSTANSLELHRKFSREAAFVPETDGVYDFTLMVCNECGECDWDTVRITIVHDDECTGVASADASIIVGGGDEFYVLSSTSKTNDTEGSLSYKWSVVSRPQGSAVSDYDITNRYSSVSTLVPDIAGKYEVELEFCDKCTCSSKVISMEKPSTDDTDADEEAPKCNEEPVADAGHYGKGFVVDFDNSATPFLIQLDGTDSYDPEDDDLTFKWSVTAPWGSKIASGDIHGADTDSASFYPDTSGDYKVTLEVCDQCFCDQASEFVRVIKGASLGACQHAPFAYTGRYLTYEYQINFESEDKVSVRLDGRDSYDSDNDVLMYTWTVRSVPERSEVSDDTLNGAHSVQATFVPDLCGEYHIELKVCDGCSCDRQTAKITISNVEGTECVVPCNDAPSLVAGKYNVTADFTANTTALTVGASTAAVGTIKAFSSSDPNNDNLTISWVLSSVPPGSSITQANVTGNDTDSATFTPDKAGVFKFTVRACDNCYCGEDTAYVFVYDSRCENPPYATAGPYEDVSVEFESRPRQAKSPIQLTANASDPDVADADRLTVQWSVKQAPRGSHLLDKDLVNANTTTMNFTADIAGTYFFSYEVCDLCFCNSTTTQVTVKNSLCDDPPFADPGNEQHHEVDFSKRNNYKVHLDGSNSVDENPESLKYQWSFLTVPRFSHLDDRRIRARHTSKAAFVPDVEGLYIVTLEVCDSCYCASKTVYIDVIDTYTPQPVQTTCCTVHGENSCSDPDVTAMVCQSDAYCCQDTGHWDDWCVHTARLLGLCPVPDNALPLASTPAPRHVDRESPVGGAPVGASSDFLFPSKWGIALIASAFGMVLLVGFVAAKWRRSRSMQPVRSMHSTFDLQTIEL